MKIQNEPAHSRISIHNEYSDGPLDIQMITQNVTTYLSYNRGHFVLPICNTVTLIMTSNQCKSSRMRECAKQHLSCLCFCRKKNRHILRSNLVQIGQVRCGKISIRFLSRLSLRLRKYVARFFW